MFESTRCYASGEVFKNTLWENVFRQQTQVLFDRMNHYKDHLDNIRLSYGRDPETNEVAILKESHYYPFACPERRRRRLEHQGYVSNHKMFEAYPSH